jgi:hypothetical protein
MVITNAFRNAVSTGDVRGIRIMMKDSLLVDPSFTEFNEMNRIAGSVTGLYDVHDGSELNGDKSAWNDDYMNKMMVQVVNNFSHERVDHLKEIVKQLRPPSSHSQQTTSTHQRMDYGSTYNNRNIKIAAGAAGGGIAGGVIAGIAGGSVIIGAVIGAVAVGAVVAVVTNGE